MKMVRINSWLLAILILMQVAATAQENQKTKDFSSYVNPFIGTGGHGHTFPGASVPFGMVQLSPDTRLTGWDGCSAYHYSDSVVYGFSHTHLSGTGCSDYGDVLFMPFNSNVSVSNYGYASSFSHLYEKASPGYYAIYLNSPGIQAELTATARTGMHRYTYNSLSNQKLIIDLKHRDQVLDSYIKIKNNKEICGFRKSKAWAEEQYVFFSSLFNKPFSKIEIYVNDTLVANSDSVSGTNLKIVLTFDSENSKELLVKCGISGVSADGAAKNLASENPGWDFDAQVNAAKSLWNKELGKIVAEGGTKDEQVKFYTALYHCMLQPNIYSDVDGFYRGRDLKIHQAVGFDYYTVFSLWDTYRAEHPLFTIIDQKRTLDFIKTFLAQFEQVGKLPVWELSGNETDCMIGFHSVSVIADALVKGIKGFDVNEALNAMKISAIADNKGYEGFVKYGFVPGNDYNESVSKTLEFAYDSWCIAQVAKIAENEADYETFIKQSQYYKNIFDPFTGFMRPKINGKWYAPFNPTEVNFHFTEANSWQYSFYVPQDISGFYKLYGGKKKLSEHLDSLFLTKAKLSGREQSDITGLIGQYAHGNEPSHHIAYLYTYLGEPAKTQEIVRKIMTTLYSNEPEGLSGNEDCGQMSAWYVMSALGFYQVCPGQIQYSIGTPLFDKVTINLENGQHFVISSSRKTSNDFNISSVKLNGKQYNKAYINHNDILKGGSLDIELSSTAYNGWATCDTCVPVTSVEQFPVVTVPWFKYDKRSFSGAADVEIITGSSGDKLFYTLDGSIPTKTSTEYKNPVKISETTLIKAVAYNESIGYSPVQDLKMIKVPSGRTVVLKNLYSKPYTAGGTEGLIDGIRGGTSFMSDAWQGYQGNDFEAIVFLGESQTVKKISVGFLQSIGSWIWMPTYVEIYTSNDGVNFTKLGSVNNSLAVDDYSSTIKEFSLEKKVKTKYIKVFAKNFGIIPDWHLGSGGEAWIFVDEITIE